MMKKRKDDLSNNKEALIQQLKDTAKENSKPLSKRMLKKMGGHYSVSSYEKHFGSWNKAKEAAGLEVIGSYEKRNINNRYRDVPLKLRFVILERDDFSCQYCGRTPQDGAKLTIDHVIPFAKGGLTIYENLITACFECNIGKRDALINLNNNKKN